MAIDVCIKKKIGNFILDVSFQSEDEVFAILGASGCGKSMTLKCIAGIEKPDEGHIILNDRVLFDSKKKINLPPQKRKVGYMFQDYALFPNMTVEQNIMIGMGKNPAEHKVHRYLKQFQLLDYKNALPKELSGGQKQRVALARMIASEPEILLFDEPLSALDTYLKWQVEEELLDFFRHADKTILYVTHSRDEVYHLSDRVCVLEKGQVETIQKKKDFFADPQTVAAARLSGCRNIAKAKRLSDHELYVEDWDMHFFLEREVPKDVAYAGIRAHYIEVLPEDAVLEDGQPNYRVMMVDHLMEQQFESELILRCDEKTDAQMRLLMDKKKALELALKENVTIHIPEQALLLLKK